MGVQACRDISGACPCEQTVAQDPQVANRGRYGGPRRVTHLVRVQDAVVVGEIAAILWCWLARATGPAFPLGNDAERGEHRA